MVLGPKTRKKVDLSEVSKTQSCLVFLDFLPDIMKTTFVHYQSYSTEAPLQKPPLLFEVLKRRGAFPETAKIFRFWFVFTVGNALKCFGNECFPLKNSNFESCF